jgi:adenosylcobyric acid synthase
MNPVLLKPTSDRTSQVVVMGRPWRVRDAVGYHRAKPELAETVQRALDDLRSRFDLVICEGAGSPAEINLLDHDLVNLGLAVRAGIPAVVVGDIDRGGVFAHLYGTVAILPEDLRRAVRGFIVNKFRGDRALLGNATDLLAERTGVPTLGVLPYLDGLWIDAEDSLALGPGAWGAGSGTAGRGDLDAAGCDVVLDVAVVRLPRIANFTDLDPLAAEPGVAVRLVEHPATLGDPDLIVLPGTKSTVADLEWLRRRGMAVAVAARREGGSVVLGICGGYQMLGTSIEDPDQVESPVPVTEGLGLLAVRTRFVWEKRTVRRSGVQADGGEPVAGYEIHHGRPIPDVGAAPWFQLQLQTEVGGSGEGTEPEGVRAEAAGVYGTSLHGLFEPDAFRTAFLQAVADRRAKRWVPSGVSFAVARQAQIDRLADACEEHLDLEALWSMAAEGAGTPR